MFASSFPFSQPHSGGSFMSINSLTNAAISRRTDFHPHGQTPQGLAQIAQAAYTTPSVTPPPTAANAATPTPPGGVGVAFNVLFGYIPTEVVTLYVAFLAGINTTDAVTPGDRRTFWGFLCVTPLVVWLVYAAKIKAERKPLPVKFSAWPLWEMFAGTMAYAAWAIAMPNTPFQGKPWHSPGLAAVLVLGVSAALGLFAPLFQKPLKI
jgi:hypothetical protein